MSKRRIILVAVLAVVFSLWLVLPPVLQFCGQEMLIRAQQQGLKVRVDNLEGARIGLTADMLETWIPVPTGSRRPPTFPVSLTLNNLDVRVHVPVLSPLSLGAKMNADLYGGAISAAVDGLIFRPTLSGVLKGIDLSLHPQLKGFGVDSGLLDAEFTHHPLVLPAGRDASYLVEARGLSVSLPPLVAQFARIRSLTDVDIRIQGILKENGRFQVNPSTLKGSFGEASFVAHGLAEGAELREVAGSIEVQLGGQDGEALKPWVGMIVGGAEEDSTGAFRCAFRTGACGASAPMQFMLGKLCILASCSR